MDPNFIISPVVGAAIGGFANWLAIQMLFFPLTEKRIFGFRIPFTPGLVPKERKRIAQSVAETVANYFLSEDVIVNAVVSPRAEEQFKHYIRELIVKQKKSKETIGALCENIFGRNIVGLYEENEEKVLDFIEVQIRFEDFTQRIAKSINDEIGTLSEKSLLELTEKNEEEISDEFGEKLSAVLGSKALGSFIGGITASQLQTLLKSKKRLGDILPDEITDFIKAKSVSNSDKVSEMIIDFITSSSVQFKMRKFLRNSFESSFKMRMLSKVVDIEKVFENILEELVSFLEQPESRREIANFLIKTIDGLENRKMSELSDEYGIEFENEKVIQIARVALLSIGDRERISGLISTSGVLNSKIKDLVESLDTDLIKDKEEWIKKTLNFVLDSVSVKEILKPILRVKVDELSQIEAGRVLDFIKDNEISMIEDVVVTNFKKLIRGESDRIVEIIDISKIVEDKINAFDIGEMEEIMLGVIRKDIVVMRAFEAGIGFLIGFFIPLYPYILRLFR